ncbi:hypothetical protein BHE74_00029203 [Ensete ventricosum]|nr:hypothetical protein BHE74_00029203 [Ensete ventricosum]
MLRASMWRVVSALLSYIIFRFDGDCVAPNDAAHWAHPLVVTHRSCISESESREAQSSLEDAQVKRQPVPGFDRDDPSVDGDEEELLCSSGVELHAPLLGEHPYDAFLSGFSLSTDALEAGLRFPLHPVIVACLKGWQISPSQMVPNSWLYLVAFLWECYGSGIVATRDMFMSCFRLSRGQARYYLIAHTDSKWVVAFQQQGLEVALFLHFLSSGLELLDRVDLSDGEQLSPGAFSQ